MPNRPAIDPVRPLHHRLLLLAGLGVWMALCYFPPQQWAAGSPWVVPRLPFEPDIPYHPLWVIVYQSIWPAHAAMLVAVPCADTVRRYTRDTMATYGLAAPWFWLMPTTVGRPDDGDLLYRSLVLALDGTTNALPSLHAVMVTLVVLHLKSRIGRPLLALLTIWWTLVLGGTLATGQHRVLDLIAGIGLAIAVHYTRASPHPAR